MFPRRVRQLVRPDGAGVLEVPLPLRKEPVRGLDPRQQMVVVIQPEHTDRSGGQLLAVQRDAVGMDDGDAFGDQCAIRLAEPKLAAVQCQRTAAGLDVDVLQRLRPRQHR